MSWVAGPGREKSVTVCRLDVPVQGMSESPTPATAANAAAEAVRTLNHLSIGALSPGRPGWEDLIDVSVVVAELRVLAERLPQAFDQLARVFEQPAMSFDTDDGSDPADITLTAGAGLLGARGQANDLARSLARAHDAISHLVVVDAGQE